ncbi:MAG: hypothetical protein NTV34_03385, partial [Proteobacteria bacterium]|nr:hypothetical protein [Pseudomonadota bacterium]
WPRSGTTPARGIMNTENKKLVKIVIESQLDLETIKEIEIMRTLRIEHYQKLARFPEQALVALKKIGLTEETSPETLKSNALKTISELEARLQLPNTIFEEELTFYVETLTASV